jgi:hypothetical protein
MRFIYLAIILLILVITPVIGCGKYTKQQAEDIARDLIEKSPTFRYDGLRESLELVKVEEPEEKNTWRFTYIFESRHAGYGDRSDQMIAEVLTPHEAVVTVKENMVETAILDGEWNIRTQSPIASGD